MKKPQYGYQRLPRDSPDPGLSTDPGGLARTDEKSHADVRSGTLGLFNRSGVNSTTSKRQSMGQYLKRISRPRVVEERAGSGGGGGSSLMLFDSTEGEG